LAEVKITCTEHERLVVIEQFSKVRAANGATGWLPGGRRGTTWRETSNPGGVMGEVLRVRMSLSCRYCRKPVPARRDKLNPILDTLVEHGINAITWQALAARL
jgi:hypothetical protein